MYSTANVYGEVNILDLRAQYNIGGKHYHLKVTLSNLAGHYPDLVGVTGHHI